MCILTHHTLFDDVESLVMMSMCIGKLWMFKDKLISSASILPLLRCHVLFGVLYSTNFQGYMFIYKMLLILDWLVLQHLQLLLELLKVSMHGKMPPLTQHIRVLEMITLHFSTQEKDKIEHATAKILVSTRTPNVMRLH